MRPYILTLAIVAASGCAPAAPQLDNRFGASVRTLMAQQARPAQAHAGGESLDAAAAHGALSQYRQSFHAPAPPARTYFGTAGGANAGN